MAAECRKCRAYDSFHKLHGQIRSRYSCLSPEETLEVEAKSRTEFIRGGIVAMMAAWESYVHDLLNEAFDDFVDVCSGETKSLKDLETRWLACSDFIN